MDNNLPIEAIPGKQFHYSSNGYSILGHLAEVVSGKTYGDVVREKIRNPLRMDDSETVLVNQMRTRLAKSYLPLHGDRPEHPSDPTGRTGFYEYTKGAGSVSCTVPDLAAYLRMLLNRGQGVLTDESFALLTQRAVRRNEDDYYGCGLEILGADGDTLLRHGGGCFGFRSMLIGHLDEGLGVVLLANGPVDIGAAQFALNVIRAAIAADPLPDLSTPPSLKVDTAKYQGTYVHADGSLLRFETAAEGSLVLSSGEQSAPLVPRGPDTFCCRHPDFSCYLLRFSRQAGKVVEVSYGSDWYTNDQYSGPWQFEFPSSWSAYPGRYRATTLPPTFLSVVLRKGKLLFVSPQGNETLLQTMDENTFQIGEVPEWLRFDTIVDGKSLRVDYSGVTCYRQ